MTETIRISQSPFAPPLELAYLIAFKLHVPSSDEGVTLMVAPNTLHYEDEVSGAPNPTRQAMTTGTTDQTKELYFDLAENKKQSVTIEDADYTIELVNIGKETVEGQNFRYYEFNVNEG